MKRSGLGRGLDALLPPATSAADTAGPQGLREIPLEAIAPNSRQPRRAFDEGGLDELAVSIRQLGLLQPVIVRQSGQGYELVAGERRWRAAGRAGLERVPAVVIETDDSGALERALVENLQRADLNAIEEAAAYRQLMDDLGLTHEALAERLGRNRVTITNTLRLLDLPLGVQRLIANRHLSPAHGKVLLTLSGNPFLERVAMRAAEEGLSVRETQAQVQRYESLVGGDATSRSAPRSPVPPAAAEAQRALSDGLQTRVRIEMGKRKGKIVVDFVSLEELERVVSLILESAGPATSRVAPD
ncbi:MAG: ParB family transcriptional regulator, chromosome partitioning protein [Actinomycetota bacterium]|jgi:ParB family chromosome partitioning protein|nr:ParB family transcriptional regulator, chromosome partitioning protein [Actinomycetota bacterium]